MPLLGTTAANQALNGLDASGTPANQIGFLSAHTASPGTTGANEVSGGGYSRQAITWAAASSSAKTNSSAVTITTAGATPVTHVAGQSAASAGNYGIGATLASPVTATSITVAIGAVSLSAS